MTKSIFVLAFVLLAYVALGSEVPGDDKAGAGDVAADIDVDIEIPDFRLMKIRELKAFIARKGTECVACSSKTDLIERAEEVKEWPDKEPEVKEPSKEELDEVLKNLENDKERMDKLREDLKKAGLDMSKFGNGKDGGPKIFSAEDLAQFVKQNPPPATDEETEKKEEESTEEKAEL